MRSFPQRGTPNFRPELVLLVIYNLSKFEVCGFSGLYIALEELKKIIIKIVSKPGQTNISRKKVVDSVLENHKAFFYQDCYFPRYTRLNLFPLCQFLTDKIVVTRPGAPKLGELRASIYIHIVLEFRLSMSSRFQVINKLINFRPKNCHFFLGFWVPKSRSHDQESPKLAYMTLYLLTRYIQNSTF